MITIKEVYEVTDPTGFFEDQHVKHLCDWEFDELPKEGDIIEFEYLFYKVYAIVFNIKYKIIKINVTKL